MTKWLHNLADDHSPTMSISKVLRTKYRLVCKSLRRVTARRQSLEALDCPWTAPTFTFPGYGSLAVTEVSLMGNVACL